jgi:hypothetical protein
MMNDLPSSFSAILRLPTCARGCGLRAGRARPFELLLVGFVGAQRLAERQQEVAGKAVLDLDGVAHLAEAGNAFEENDFHLLSFQNRKRSNECLKGRKQAGAVRRNSLSCPWQLGKFSSQLGFSPLPKRDRARRTAPGRRYYFTT